MGLQKKASSSASFFSRRATLGGLVGLSFGGMSLKASAGAANEDEVRRSERRLLHHPVLLDELTPLSGAQPPKSPAGSITVLHLWAVECKPCVEEMPALREMADSFGQRSDVRLLMASETEDDSALSRFLSEHRTTMPERGHYKLGQDSRLRSGLGVNNQPLTLLLDELLIIRQAFIGSLKNRREVFNSAIDRLSRGLRKEPAMAPALDSIAAQVMQPAALRRIENSLLHCRYRRQDAQKGRLFVVSIFDANDAAASQEAQRMRSRESAFRSWEGVRFLYIPQPGSPAVTLLLDGQSIIRDVYIGSLLTRANEFVEGMNWLFRALGGKPR